MGKRKHILLKNEIELIQDALLKKCFLKAERIQELIWRLEELKKEWYKSK